MLMIGTYSGMLDADNPAGYAFDVGEIAYCLATIHRFNGHRGKCSVAEHAMTVARRVYTGTSSPLAALVALHHDSSEAYLGDMIGPVRSALSRITVWYESLHDRVTEAIMDQVCEGLPWRAAGYTHKDLISQLDKAHGREQLLAGPSADRWVTESEHRRVCHEFVLHHRQYLREAREAAERDSP